MKSLSKKYKNAIVFATLIQPNTVSVLAQIDTDRTIVKNIYQEKIYKTNNLSGAIDYYIKTNL